MPPKKIAITGPESTGKSALSKALAIQHKTTFVPEYARCYLNDNGLEYTKEDLEIIARRQMEMEDKIAAMPYPIIFCDTEMIVMKIWYEHFFGAAPEWMQKEIQSRHYDLYLLMDIDIAWEKDPMREHADKRHYFFELFKQTLESINAPYKIISGQGKDRLKAALSAINSIE